MTEVKNKWSLELISGLRTVYSHRNSWVVTVMGFLVIMFVASFISSWGVLQFTFSTPLLSFWEKFSSLFSITGLYLQATPPISLMLTMLVGVLTGVNVAIVVYYVKQRVKVQQAAGVSLVGLIISLFGVGCSACGSVLLSSLLGFGATTQVLGVLPLHGLEFSLLSAILLAVVTGYLAIKANNPLVCNAIKSETPGKTK